MRICTVEGCERQHAARGWCQKHYARWRKHGDPLAVGVPYRRAARTCFIMGCEAKATRRGMCDTHYRRYRKHGSTDDPVPPQMRWLTSHGYVYVLRPGHSMADRQGRILEHRLVMCEHLGRPLLTTESVHHVNGDRADNRIDNLELWSSSQPAGQRVEDKVAWAIDILRVYSPTSINADTHG